MIWALMGFMALAGAALVLLQLFHKGDGSLLASDATLAVLKNQLSELQRDSDRGVISSAEAQAASQEIKRRILIQGREETKRAKASNSRAALIIATAFVPLFAGVYYYYAGAPTVTSMAFADRKAEIEEQNRIDDLMSRLASQLENDPDGGAIEGWMLLGQTYVRLNRNADAVEAFGRAALKDGADTVVFSMLGEALIFAEQGIVTPEAERAIDQALALDPTNPAAIYYKATALSQGGEEAAAHDLLLARLNIVTTFEPWMESYVVRANMLGQSLGRADISLADYAPMLNGAAPGPTAEDVEAASEMTDAERGEFIRSMVARLAERLDSEPDDLEGWMRLGNAYRVLNETDNAIAAYTKAEALLANAAATDPMRAEVAAALSALRGSQ